jgi:hypothetical protein
MLDYSSAGMCAVFIDTTVRGGTTTVVENLRRT